MSGAISFGAGGTGSALLPSNLGVKSAAASTSVRGRVGSSSLKCRAMSARPETFLIEQSFGPTPKDSLRARFERMIFEAQDAICAAVEEMDGGATFVEDVHFKPKMTDFTKAGTEGGGATRVLQDGNVWEKAGVSVSTNAGLMTPDIYRSANPEYEVFKKGLVPFFAVGISSVMHPKNPFAPTVHFNYRFFETNCPKDDLGTPNKWWFGGGTDLTPSYLIEEDVKHFHAVQKQACDKFDTSLYPKFKKTCDDYFFIPHRGERRGLGGIFYEDLHDRDQEILFELAKELSSAVIPAYLPIIEKRKDMPYSDKHKSWQQQRRGRYVEFNLVYDRGTVFGMKTKARMESVLMSLPLTARWEYNQHPEEGSEEWKLLDACINPKEWV